MSRLNEAIERRQKDVDAAYVEFLSEPSPAALDILDYEMGNLQRLLKLSNRKLLTKQVRGS